MGYLFNRTETKDKVVFELRMKNWYIFTALAFLSVIPVVFIAVNYVENITLFRVWIVFTMLCIYALLDGGAIMKIIFSKNKTREGSAFRFSNPRKYIITK
ncbi:MAG: hypothetical protein GOV00_00250 [Candidatus Altiarchaeota archaeon]|nr:hypothetical protein [Candidatus Altiarchaeota archaeon]